MEIKEHISLAPYTVYKIGGPARYFGEAASAADILQGLDYAKAHGVPVLILGAGSNVLISDRGFSGLVIHIVNGDIKVQGSEVVADAGVSMARLVAIVAARGLTGIEWAIGIPGTVGGSVRGNAGCFGGEMKDVVDTVRVYDQSRGQEFILPADHAEFQYRDSVFKRHPEWIIISAAFALLSGDPARSQELIREYALKRSNTQAIGSKSAGCIFKNVSWGRKDIDKTKLLARFPDFQQFAAASTLPAAYLIDRAGLKGRRIGDIEISEKHANYFVNYGSGTAEEVVMLVAVAKEYVHRLFGISLEEEIQYVGF